MRPLRTSYLRLCLGVLLAMVSAGTGGCDHSGRDRPPIRTRGVQGDPAAPVVGRAQPGRPGDPLALALAETKPPDWVSPSARISYYVAHTTGGSRGDDGGQDRADPRASASGHGYVQHDIVAIDGQNVLLETRVSTMVGMSSPPMLASVLGQKLDLATGGGLWQHPQSLARQAKQAEGDANVFVGPYQLGDRTYNVIRFIRGASSWTYDLSSGLQIQEILAGDGKADRDAGPATGRADRSPTRRAVRENLNIVRLAGFRRLAVPWADGRMPPWTQQVRKLRYGGQIISTVRGAGQHALPSTAVYEIKERGTNWLLTEQTVHVGGAGVPQSPQTVTRIFAAASVGGLWIDPAKIRDLKQGQELDADGLARTRTTVTRFLDHKGQPCVEITEAGGAHRVVLVYDRQYGVLRRSSHLSQLGTGTIEHVYELAALE